MNDRDLTPDPLRDARFGVAYTASLGMFDTAGWTPPAAGTYAEFDTDVRRDYGPKGCAGIVLGAVGLLLAFVAIAVVLAVMA